MAVESLPLTTIGIVIVVAIVLSIAARRIGLNPVLGYIISGFLLGPFFLRFLHPEDALVAGFGEMGLFILLFYLGLELSLKDFLAAGSTAFGLAIIDMIALAGTGFLILQLFGYSLLFSVVVGFMLFATSTAVVAKFCIDRGLMQNASAQLAVAILILQDFLGILLLVLVASLSGAGGGGAAMELALTAAVFAIATFYVVHELSKFVEKWLMEHGFGHSEITLYALGVGLVVATLASVLDLSTALGAYFAGFALAETQAGKRIKNDVQFLRDFFLVFFFVAFGTTLFYSHVADAVVIPAAAELGALAGLAVLLSAGIILANFLVFGLFGTVFGLTKEDSSIAAVLLTPLGEFVVIIATAATPLFPVAEQGVISTIAFLLIAVTVIVFSPLYGLLPVHQALVKKLPLLKKREVPKTRLKKYDEFTRKRFRAVGVNALIVLSLAWIGLKLYASLPSFGVPIIYSREVTGLIVFGLFAIPPMVRAFRAFGELALHAVTPNNH